MKKRATIKDIARETGLSIATVSRVINKKEGHYSPETKNSIEKAIKKLKYKPHIGAISLKKQKTRTIGFVAPELMKYIWVPRIMHSSINILHFFLIQTTTRSWKSSR